ncbi:MAG: molybdopterin-binding protein [Polyangiales bacterium]
MATVSVHRRPRVAVVTTGSELRPVDAPPEPGTIVNSNAYALAAQITRAGGQPIVLDTAHDDVDAIAARIQAGLANADALVTVGGVSVGEHDLVHAALGKLGIEVALWKVAMKPGKPLTFALAGAVPIVGLPGNPVSASVAFEVFVRPGLRIQLGDRRPFPAPVPAELTAPSRGSPAAPSSCAQRSLQCWTARTPPRPSRSRAREPFRRSRPPTRSW